VDIKFKGVEVVGPSNRPFYLATVKFSNGEVVVFSGAGTTWDIGLPNRRFFEAATG
jgi:hypothetical protein